MTMIMATVLLALLLCCVQMGVALEGQAVQLIYPDSFHQKLLINDNAADYLKNLTGKVAVVSVIGPFHSGKSLLLNKVLNIDDAQRGFVIGETTSPSTQGIWMWQPAPVVKTDKGEDLNLIVFDTEGFYSSLAGRVYDSKVFAIATLASSLLLYNSVKIIDSQSIDNLEFLAWEANLFSSRARVNDPMFESPIPFPHLTWVVQDFAQDFPEGISDATDWLTKLIAHQHRDRDESGELSSLASIFPSIDCFTISPPTVDKDHLRNLMRASNDALSKDYVSDVRNFQTFLQRYYRPKTVMENSELNGPALLQLIRFLVNASNGDSFPKVRSVWENFFNDQFEQAVSEAAVLYDKLMSTVDSVPLTTSQLNDLHLESVEAAIIALKASLFNVASRFAAPLEQLKMLVGTRKERFWRRNAETVAANLSTTMTLIFNRFQDTIEVLERPLPRTELRSRVDTVRKTAAAEYNERLGIFRDSPAFDVQLARLHEKINATIPNLESRNQAAITTRVRTTVSNCSAYFVRDFVVACPIPTKQLIAEFEKVRDSMLAIFDTELAAFMAEDSVKLARRDLESHFNILFNNQAKQNEQEISATANKAIQWVRSSFDNEVTSLRADPPLATQVFFERFSAIEARFSSEFNSAVGVLGPDCEKSFDDLKLHFRETFNKMNTENAQKILQYFRSLESQCLVDLKKATDTFKIPVLEDDMNFKFKDVHDEILHKFDTTLEEYDREDLAFRSVRASLMHEIDVARQELRIKNIDAKNFLMKTQFERAVAVYKAHLEPFEKQTPPSEELNLQHIAGGELASNELDKLQPFKDEAEYKWHKEQSEKEIQMHYETVIKGINELLNIKLEAKAKELLVFYENEVNKMSLDAIPKPHSVVEGKLLAERKKTIEAFQAFSSRYSSEDSSQPGVAFSFTAKRCLDSLKGGIKALEQRYFQQNIETLQRLSGNARRRALESMTVSDESFWTLESFDKWLEDSVKKHMLEHIAADPAVKSLMEKEKIPASEIVEFVVVKGDPLGEQQHDGVNIPSNLIERVHTQRRNIKMRGWMVKIGASLTGAIVVVKVFSRMFK